MSEPTSDLRLRSSKLLMGCHSENANSRGPRGPRHGSGCHQHSRASAIFNLLLNQWKEMLTARSIQLGLANAVGPMIPRWGLTPPCRNGWIVVSISLPEIGSSRSLFEVPLFAKTNAHTGFVGADRVVVVGAWGVVGSNSVSMSRGIMKSNVVVSSTPIRGFDTSRTLSDRMVTPRGGGREHIPGRTSVGMPKHWRRDGVGGGRSTRVREQDMPVGRGIQNGGRRETTDMGGGETATWAGRCPEVPSRPVVSCAGVS